VNPAGERHERDRVRAGTQGAYVSQERWDRYVQGKPDDHANCGVCTRPAERARAGTTWAHVMGSPDPGRGQ
jgi:hypothetical protein